MRRYLARLCLVTTTTVAELPLLRGGSWCAQTRSAATTTPSPSRDANGGFVEAHLRPPIYDAVHGSDYYFPDDVVDAPVPPPPPSNGNTMPVTCYRTPATPPAEGSRASGTSVVCVRGAATRQLFNTMHPPITREEAEAWKLDSLLYRFPIYFLPTFEKTRYLLPPSQPIVSLGPRIHKLDWLYRQKGFYAISEVAHALFAFVPTFFVESRHVVRALPPNLLFRIESDFGQNEVVSVVFHRYPMLFVLRRARFQRTTLKLNSDFDFVRNHPDYGKGDRLHHRHNADYNASVGGIVDPHAPTGAPLTPRSEAATAGGRAGYNDAAHGDARGGASSSSSAAADHASSSTTAAAAASSPSRFRAVEHDIFDILVRHLPRVPMPNKVASNSGSNVNDADEAAVLAERYRVMPLVSWVNSFTRAELSVLNTVPQQRVVTVLSRYVHIFQLTSLYDGPGVEDSNLFVEHSRLPYCASSTTSTETAAAAAAASDDKSSSNSSSTTTTPPAVAAAATAVKGDAASSTRDKSEDAAVVQERVQRFTRSVQDDLVDLDSDLAKALTEAGDGDSAAADDKAVAGDKDDVGAFDDNNDAADDNEADKDDDDNDDFDDDDDDVDERAVGEDGKATSAAASSSSQQQQRQGDSGNDSGDSDVEDVCVALERIGVRRLPPHIAPRSLSDYSEHNSPEPELVRHLASRLPAPPSLRAAVKASHGGSKLISTTTLARLSAQRYLFRFDNVWRWVPLSDLYAMLTPTQRASLRRYRGLANFLRLHGTVFELSRDLCHVLAHDPEGIVAPLLPTQQRFNFEERVVLPRDFDADSAAAPALIGAAERHKFERVLGASQIPTTRSQLVLLDPHNPLLLHNVLAEEVARLLPDHPVTKGQLMTRMPPVMRAALASRSQVLSNSAHLTTWTEKGQLMVQRKDLALPDALRQPRMSVEDALDELLAVVPEDGVVVRAVRRLLLSSRAADALMRRYGNVYKAVCAYPQYFTVERAPNVDRDKAIVRRRAK